MVRCYSPEPLESEQLERILEKARRHPSAGFSQGIHFVLITDPARRLELARLAGEEDYAARGFARWLSVAAAPVDLAASQSDYERRYAEADKTGTDDWSLPYWWVDAGAALMLLLLAAAEEGLGAGFLGAHRLAGVKELLEIPEGVHPVGLVTLGHPLSDRPSSSLKRGRKALSELVHRERW